MAKSSIVLQSIYDLFDEVIHSISLKVPKRRLWIDWAVLDISGDVINLSIRRE